MMIPNSPKSIRDAVIHPAVDPDTPSINNNVNASTDVHSEVIQRDKSFRETKPATNWLLSEIKLYQRELIVCALAYTVYCVLVVGMTFLVAALNEYETEQVVQYGIAAEMLGRLNLAFQRSTAGLVAIGSTISALDSCHISSSTLGNATKVAEYNSNGIDVFPEQFFFDAQGELVAAYPAITDSAAALQLGHNSLDGEGREEYLRRIRIRGVSLGMPSIPPGKDYRVLEAAYSVWLPAMPGDTDVGCKASSFNCSADCFDSLNGYGLYGTTRSVYRLSDVLSSVSPSFLDDNYHSCLSVKRSGVSEGYQHLGCWGDPQQPVSTYQTILGLTFKLTISPRSEVPDIYGDPWAPRFKYMAIYVLVAAGMFPAALLFWVLKSRRKYDELLGSILPARVIKHLANDAGVFCEEFENVTILFADICDFTPLASRLTPLEIVQMLDELYSMYDALAIKHGVYKVETIGDAYMCACGCPEKADPANAAARIVSMAKDMIQTAHNFTRCYIPEDVTFKTRVGIHSGAVVAGVVGRTMPRYCLFGDVVNTASRMESTALPMTIQISDTTATLVAKTDSVTLTARAIMQVKGKGPMQTYFVDFKPTKVVPPCPSPPNSARREAKNMAFSWTHTKHSDKDNVSDGSERSYFWIKPRFAGSNDRGGGEENSRPGSPDLQHIMRSAFSSLDSKFVPRSKRSRMMSEEEISPQPGRIEEVSYEASVPREVAYRGSPLGRRLAPSPSQKSVDLKSDMVQREEAFSRPASPEGVLTPSACELDLSGKTFSNDSHDTFYQVATSRGSVEFDFKSTTFQQ